MVDNNDPKLFKSRDREHSEDTSSDEGGPGGVQGSSSDDCGVGGRFRKGRRRRVAEEADVQEALMYQPDEVDAGRCRALMWNGGRGRLQCSRKPLRGRELCGRCEAESTPYGKVRGAIPERILKLFREKALNAQRASSSLGVPRGCMIRIP